MSAIPCHLPKVTNPLDPSQDGDQQVYVDDPHVNAWKSLNYSVVHEGSHRQDREAEFTSASSELCADRMEDTKNSAVEKKLSDWLIPAGKDDSLEEPMTRPIWDRTWKKNPKGFTEKQTQQEVCERMKHVLETPCLSLKSLLVAVSEEGHHINLDYDNYCNTDKYKKISPGKSSKEFGCRRTANGQDAGKRCRLTERHLWQMVDEYGRPLPFGAVSSRRKGPNDDKRNGADIWIRLDCVSVLITQIIEEMKRDQEDRSSAKGETHVAREEENSSLETREDTEFVDIPLEQSTSEPRSCPVKKESDVTSEICHHETLMTLTSTEDSLSHPKPTLNATKIQSSSINHESSGSSETHVTDIHPTTSSSSKPEEYTTNTETCKIDIVCNSSEYSDREPAKRKSRRHGLFRRFSSLIFQCWRDKTEDTPQ